MPVRDKNMAGRLKRVWIPVQSMQGLDVARTASLGAGVAVFQEAVAAAEISGLAMAAAGDEVYHIMPIPYDLDRDYPMRFRIWFCHASTDTDNPDWVIALTYLGKGVLIPDASASADDTLTFAALAVAAVADALEVTSFQACDESKLAATDFAMTIVCECNGLGSASANEIELLGIELEYTRGGRSEGGRLNTDDAPATDSKVDSGVSSY